MRSVSKEEKGGRGNVSEEGREGSRLKERFLDNDDDGGSPILNPEPPSVYATEFSPVDRLDVDGLHGYLVQGQAEGVFIPDRDQRRAHFFGFAALRLIRCRLASLNGVFFCVVRSFSLFLSFQRELASLALPCSLSDATVLENRVGEAAHGRAAVRAETRKRKRKAADD